MTERPNILYIFTDQQFAGAMICAGNEDLQTLAMDRLAILSMDITTRIPASRLWCRADVYPQSVL